MKQTNFTALNKVHKCSPNYTNNNYPSLFYNHTAPTPGHSHHSLTTFSSMPVTRHMTLTFKHDTDCQGEHRLANI